MQITLKDICHPSGPKSASWDYLAGFCPLFPGPRATILGSPMYHRDTDCCQPSLPGSARSQDESGEALAPETEQSPV